MMQRGAHMGRLGALPPNPSFASMPGVSDEIAPGDFYSSSNRSSYATARTTVPRGSLDSATEDAYAVRRMSGDEAAGGAMPFNLDLLWRGSGGSGGASGLAGPGATPLSGLLPPPVVPSPSRPRELMVHRIPRDKFTEAELFRLVVAESGVEPSHVAPILFGKVQPALVMAGWCRSAGYSEGSVLLEEDARGSEGSGGRGTSEDRWTCHSCECAGRLSRVNMVKIWGSEESSFGKTRVQFDSAEECEAAFLALSGPVWSDKENKPQKRVYLKSGGYINVKKINY